MLLDAFQPLSCRHTRHVSWFMSSRPASSRDLLQKPRSCTNPDRNHRPRTIVGATAQNVNALIGAFVLIGASAGAGLSFFWVFWVLSEHVPMNHRLIANSLLYFITIWSTGLGATVATAMLNTGPGWRTTLWFMTALNGTGAICWALFYFPPTFEQLHRRVNLVHFITKFDYVGFVLFVAAGTLLFLLGLSWGGGLYAWNSAHVTATLVVGAVLLIISLLRVSGLLTQSSRTLSFQLTSSATFASWQ